MNAGREDTAPAAEGTQRLPSTVKKRSQQQLLRFGLSQTNAMNIKRSDDHHARLNLNKDINEEANETAPQAAQTSPAHVASKYAADDEYRAVHHEFAAVPSTVHAVAVPRGKIQIRRIPNPSSRQVTFCKRRRGLLKKAQELSTLCDAHVAVIIFSATGRLYHFCNTSMELILDRYNKSNIGSFDQARLACSIEYWKEEVARRNSKLKAMQNALRYGEIATINALPENTQLMVCERQIAFAGIISDSGTSSTPLLFECCRRLMGEDLELSPLQEIENLESQLREAIERVRSRQTKLLMEQVQGLKEQAQLLIEENKMLKAKMLSMEGEQRSSWTSGNGMCSRREYFLRLN